MNPRVNAYIQQAIHDFENGNFAGAEGSLKRVLMIQPLHFDALHILGVIKGQQNKHAEAKSLFSKAIRVNPTNGYVHFNLAKSLSELSLDAESIQHHEKAIAFLPNHSDAFLNYGKSLFKLNRNIDALKYFNNAIHISPNSAEAFANQGCALHALKRYDEACESFVKALELNPEIAETWSNFGATLNTLMQDGASVNAFERAIQINPAYFEAWSNKGVTLNAMHRYQDALNAHDRSLSINPLYAAGWSNKGAVLENMSCHTDAIMAYERAIQLDPNFVEPLVNKGNALRKIRDFGSAIHCYEQALGLDPANDYLFGSLLAAKMHACQWADINSQIDIMVSEVNAGHHVVVPFDSIFLTGLPPVILRAAELWVRDKYPVSITLPPIEKNSETKIRVGYFSADFREHPVALLTAELFELHDRDRFEIVAFSFGINTQDAMRVRLEGVFDKFIDVRNLSAIEIAQLARSMEVEIAVDLTGLTDGCRPDMYLYRVAPIQVNFLGYPGSTGISSMDYIIADSTVIPEIDKHSYSEKIVFLPDSFMPNDTSRLISEKAMKRYDFDLPEVGFVYCCFNNSYKISPSIFDGWMRILSAVDGSVLWLSALGETAQNNLRQEAVIRGVDPRRLVFAKKMAAIEEHLARHRLADLFLDTLPYNAHTTACDALWSGLPIVTCQGSSFAGRVTASLLKAIDLPELITRSQDEYDALAIQLALDPERRALIKEKLAINKLRSPLFDLPKFVRNIEKAYVMMSERYKTGLLPDDIYVSSPSGAQESILA